jgi:acyl phosphate:glycerol-3-phosphate acyltransferase
LIVFHLAFGSGRVSFEFIASLLGALVFGYLCGSIPFGLLLTRWAGTADLRSIGSGNIGATNVLRTGRKDLAAATLILDALKGTFAVLVSAFALGPKAALAAAVGAFLGHLFPVWLRFKGGKGVATFLGCLIGVAWPGALVFAATWLIVAFLTRYSSAAALTASFLSSILLYFVFHRWEAGLTFIVLTVILWIKHRPNLERLLAGTETRIGQKG